MRLVDQLAGWIDHAVEEHSQGETVRWDLVLSPDPRGTGQPVYMVFAWVPGTVIGTWIAGSMILVDPPSVTIEAVSDVIQQFLAAMRQQRSALLDQQTLPPPQANGAGRIILPGAGRGH